MAIDSGRLDALLREFEGRIDKQDPQQVQLWEEARQLTTQLHRARGDWERPSSSRCWNADVLPEKETPPLELPSYRDYVASKRTLDAVGKEFPALPAADASCRALPAPPPGELQHLKSLHD